LSVRNSLTISSMPLRLGFFASPTRDVRVEVAILSLMLIVRWRRKLERAAASHKGGARTVATLPLSRGSMLPVLKRVLGHLKLEVCTSTFIARAAPPGC